MVPKDLSFMSSKEKVNISRINGRKLPKVGKKTQAYIFPEFSKLLAE